MNAFIHLSLDNDTSSTKSLVSSSNFNTVFSTSNDLTSLISGMPQDIVADNSTSSMMLNKALTITVLFDQNNNLLTTAPLDLGNDASFRIVKQPAHLTDFSKWSASTYSDIR